MSSISLLSRPTARRTFAVAAASVLLTGTGLLLAAPASAHVTVNPRQATQGGYEKLVFRVPNESDTASTTKVVVTLPLDTPLSSVRYKPHAGWDAVIATKKLDPPVTVGDTTLDEAPATITWTAQAGTKIAPGQFDEFEVSAGPLPETDTLYFPAQQSYDDGSVVEWSEIPEEGAEAEHPAPALKLTAAVDAAAPSATPSVAAPSTAPVSDSSAAGDTDSSDGTARALGVAGLVVGVAGLGVAAIAVTRSRRQPNA